MRFISTVVHVWLVFFSLNALAQPAQPFPIGSPHHCVNLPNHVAIQECQSKQKAQGAEWANQDKTPLPRFNGPETRPPMNCFKRESTAEQVCAN